jgi:hypothetical protein
MAWTALDEQGANLLGPLSYHLSVPNSREASGAKTDRVNRIGGLQNHQIGIASNCEAVAVEVHHLRGVTASNQLLE